MNATERTPSRFETALEKAKRLLQLRAEQADLEAYIRDTQLELTHQAIRASNERDRTELSRQGQRLRAALLGHL
jgi:hypothetical protein